MTEYFLRNHPTESVIEHFQKASIHASNNRGIVDFLSEFIQERSLKKQNLMHYACKQGHRGLLKTLLSIYGTKDIQSKDIYGKTPLHYAKERNHLTLIRILGLCMSGNNSGSRRKQQAPKRFKYE